MPDYICVLCNYTTIYKPNYFRHLNSKKHLIKVGDLDLESLLEIHLLLPFFKPILPSILIAHLKTP